jgi:hypothetical protein
MATQPIYARRTREGWNSTGIGWDDYARMGVHTHKLFSQRRLETPTWALDDLKLREVIVTAMEQRAQLRTRDGDLATRLKRAQAEIRAQREHQIADFWRIQKRCLRRKRPTCIAHWRREIENLDTYLRTTAQDGGASLLAAVVYFYYRVGMDSVDVSKEVGIKPPHVRQIIYRLNKIAKKFPA